MILVRGRFSTIAAAFLGVDVEVGVEVDLKDVTEAVEIAIGVVAIVLVKLDSEFGVGVGVGVDSTTDSSSSSHGVDVNCGTGASCLVFISCAGAPLCSFTGLFSYAPGIVTCVCPFRRRSPSLVSLCAENSKTNVMKRPIAAMEMRLFPHKTLFCDSGVDSAKGRKSSDERLGAIARLFPLSTIHCPLSR